MPSFEEEAFARAQQMHRHTPFYREERHLKKQNEADEKPDNDSTPDKAVMQKSGEQPSQHQRQGENESLTDVLFRDKEQSLIMLLIILLMEENADPMLLLALLYLLL